MVRFGLVLLLLAVVTVAVHPPIVAACCLTIERSSCCEPSSSCCRVVQARDASAAPDKPVTDPGSGLQTGPALVDAIPFLPQGAVAPAGLSDVWAPPWSRRIRPHLALSILRV